MDLQVKKENDVSADIKTLLHSIPQVKEAFEVIEKIGEGTFSKVFRARLLGSDEEFALKYIIPTSLPSRIESELRCLLQAGGQSNVMEVSTYLMNKGHFVIVMPYFPHDRFSEYIRTMSVQEASSYMRNLFLPLERIHHLGIIHRDIKPSNFLFNNKLKKYALVDFGLAQRESEIYELVQRCSGQSSSKLAAMKAQAKQAQVNRKRTLSCLSVHNQENEVTVRSKRPCLNNPPALPVEPPPRALQPLSNRMNVTVHPVGGSQAICKPPTPILKEVLWVPNSRRNLLPLQKTTATTCCKCFGKSIVCTICLGRVSEVAPRAGTPGFRAPEVLLKYKSQTTAIDMWSAGIVFLSVLSGRYPFFKATDDLTALAEISTVIGTEKLQEVAEILGKKLTTSMTKPAMDLHTLCLKLQNAVGGSNKPTVFPDSAYDLLKKLLDPDPTTRITVDSALRHPFILNCNQIV